MYLLDKHLIVEQLLENIETTTRSVEWLELCNLASFGASDESNQQLLHDIQTESNKTIGLCNEVIRLIGGIPIRAELATTTEYSAVILEFTGRRDGEWFLNGHDTEHNMPINLRTDTVSKLKQAYLATLTPKAEEFQARYL